MLKHKYLTLTQAAKERGFTAAHLRRLILSGRLKAEKVGHSWLINQKDLAFLIRRRQNPVKDKE